MESVSEHATEVAKESWPSQRSKVLKDRDSKSKSESRFTKVQKHYEYNRHAKVRAQISEFIVVSIVQSNCSCNYGFQRQGLYARRVKKLGRMEPRQAEALSRKAQGCSTAAPGKGRPVQSEMEIQRIIQSTMGFYVRIYFFQDQRPSQRRVLHLQPKLEEKMKTFKVACENRESGSRLKEEAPKCSEKV